MLNPTPRVSSRYGAPMGRPNSDSYTDRRGNTIRLEVLPHAPPFHLVRCQLDSGGYDSGGAYWGLGDPLYYFEGPITDIRGYVRARTRDAAKAAVREIHPNVRFYR